MSLCGGETFKQSFYQLVYDHLSLGWQSLMSICGGETSTQSFYLLQGHLSLGLQSDGPTRRGNLQAVVLPAGVQPTLPRFTESDEPVWRGYLYAVILPAGVQPSLPRFTESDEPGRRGYLPLLYVVIYQLLYSHLSLGLQSLISPCKGKLYAVILTAVVQPALPRFTESDEPVWRGYLYVVFLQTLVQPSLPRPTASD